MNFKYSICHPNKSNIEYKNDLISLEEVLKIAKNYPWLEQLKIKGEEYNPSLDFTNIQNNQSFCLTAHLNNDNSLEFSLWYNRPKRVKILLGLFGEKEKMVVDDIWSFSLEDSIKYLEHFVEGRYLDLEELYK
mgnify:CR=1 FL=1